MGEHIEGKPVSATTYRYYGCRCDECCQANSDAVRVWRNENQATATATSKRNSWCRDEAWRWVCEHRPDIADQIRVSAEAKWPPRKPGVKPGRSQIDAVSRWKHAMDARDWMAAEFEASELVAIRKGVRRG